MTLIENIGPILGLVAFLGFCVFVALFVQQAREVRRLRDWAGRAPERAAAAAEREERVAALARDEGPDDQPSLLDPLRNIDPLIIGALLGAVLIGAAIFTNGFGVLDEDEGTKQAGQERRSQGASTREEASGKTKVVVLNATQPGEGLAGTPGVADRVTAEIPGGAYKVGDPDDAPVGLSQSTIMFSNGNEDEADELADSLSDLLGITLTEPMTPEVEQTVGKNVGLAVVVGIEDASIASS